MLSSVVPFVAAAVFLVPSVGNAQSTKIIDSTGYGVESELDWPSGMAADESVNVRLAAGPGDVAFETEAFASTPTPTSTPTATQTLTPVLAPTSPKLRDSIADAIAVLSPTTLSPSGAITDSTPTFQWIGVAGALRYHLAVYDKTVGSYAFLTTVAGTSYTPSTPLNTAHQYKWKVRARTAGGWGSYSGWLHFYYPFLPIPLSPGGTITDPTPRFRWTSAVGAIQYFLAVYDKDMRSYVIMTVVAGTSYTPGTPLETAHDYKWKVRAQTAGGWGGYSSRMHFVYRFIDNGDGTVTDTQTELMWEQKTDDGGIHDKDNRYKWTAGSPWEAPDGTVFTAFLAGLNNCVSTDGITITGGFAGHCDWRLSDIVELQTILLEPYPCSTSPCIDPIFGPTTLNYYWSATTYQRDPRIAWFLYYRQGLYGFSGKQYSYHVRAVRGGS